ncbi:MAG: hypothetical protein J7497_09530 [Chitinophagaceae bacterium]|nr:hypothetical protein [Chitinophagaceae bacterium]
MSSEALPIRYAKLIIKYTHRMLSEKEADELDEWICASDENLEIYEELLSEVIEGMIDAEELLDNTTEILEMWMMAALIEKERQNIISPDEKQFLKEWVEANEENEKVYQILLNPAKHQKIVVFVDRLIKDKFRRRDLN